MTGQLALPFPTTQRLADIMPASFYAPARRRAVAPDDATRGEILLFRLIERFSKRGSPALFRHILNLVKWFEKPKGGTYSERSTWAFLKRLEERGWIGRRAFHSKGNAYLQLWPMVRVREEAERVSLRRKTALKTAPTPPKNCTPSPLPSYSNELSYGEDDGMEKSAGRADKNLAVAESSAAASSPLAGEGETPPSLQELLALTRTLCDDRDALQALQVAGRNRKAPLTPAFVKRAVENVQGWMARKTGPVKPGAALTCALRDTWEAPCTATPEKAERRAPEVKTAPVEIVMAAREIDARLSGPTPLETALEGLGKAERADLIERAVAEAEKRASSPVTKKSVVGRRENHVGVQIVLRELLGLENGGKS